MQDKIQEISALIDVYAGILAEMEIEDRYDTDMHHKCSDAWFNIESKLRELVREPLDEEAIERATGVKRGTPMFLAATGFVRATERAHNITNASGVE